MTEEEIDIKYAEYDNRIHEASRRVAALEDMVREAEIQRDAIYRERDAWEDTID